MQATVTTTTTATVYYLDRNTGDDFCVEVVTDCDDWREAGQFDVRICTGVNSYHGFEDPYEVVARYAVTLPQAVAATEAEIAARGGRFSYFQATEALEVCYEALGAIE